MLGNQALAEIATVAMPDSIWCLHSPQSVLTDALYALQALEAMRARDKQAAKRGEAEPAENPATICKSRRSIAYGRPGLFALISFI